MPFGAFVDATGVDNVAAALLRTGQVVIGGTGEVEVALAKRTAAVRTTKAGAWAVVGTDTFTGNGEGSTGNESVAADTANAAYVQFGAAVRLTSGATAREGEVDLTLVVAFARCGEMVGMRTVTVSTTSSTDAKYEPVGPFEASILVAKIKATMVVTGVSGEFESRAATRTAATSPESTDAWAVLEAGYTQGATERNTGELTPSLGTNMWVQSGFAYKNSTGTGLSQATVTMVVWVRRS